MVNCLLRIEIKEVFLQRITFAIVQAPLTTSSNTFNYEDVLQNCKKCFNLSLDKKQIHIALNVLHLILITIICHAQILSSVGFIFSSVIHHHGP